MNVLMSRRGYDRFRREPALTGGLDIRLRDQPAPPLDGEVQPRYRKRAWPGFAMVRGAGRRSWTAGRPSLSSHPESLIAASFEIAGPGSGALGAGIL